MLIHPGLNGSGPDHWHTHWEQAFPDFVRVQQADWDHPVYDRFRSDLCNPIKGQNKSGEKNQVFVDTA